MHLKLDVAFVRPPFILVHFACVHFWHSVHCMEFAPTPFPHLQHGYLPVTVFRDACRSIFITLVLLMFTLSPADSNAFFHCSSRVANVSFLSLIIARSSANRISHGTPCLVLFETSSITIMNSNGLRADPWWTPC